MAVKVFNVGDVLTAADVNEWLMRRFVRKTSDQTLTSSTTVVNDNDLVFTDFQANGVYQIDCYFVCIGNDTGNIKIGWTLPSGASIFWTPAALNTSPGNDAGSIRLPASNGASPRSLGATTGANGGPLAAVSRALILMSASTGNVQIQFAQVVSNATATGLGTGSWMMAQRVS